MVRALLWDIGNVIVRWDPRTLYRKIFEEPAELDRFLSSVCTLEWHQAHDRGVSFADNASPLIAQHPHYDRQIRAWRERWAEMFSGAIPETERAIEELARQGVPQFGLSNISAEVIDHACSLSPAFARLQGIIVSGAEGLVKPDPAIFQLTCERFGLQPSEFLFVDDSLANIEQARALGFDVHHFTDPAMLAPALRRRGLLSA